MRIVIGEISHETNTFVRGLTTVADFQARQWLHGRQIVERHRGVRSELGGMIDAAERLGIDLVPTFAATTEPSGTIEAATYTTMRHQLLEGIRAAGRIDAVCLSLHGAGIAEGIDDLEGDLLRDVRQVVGPRLPVIVTLDLHGNVTQAMVDYADALLGSHFYPHTDAYERGVEAVELALRAARGEIRPVGAVTAVPILTPSTPTSLSPGREVNERCFGWEARPGVIDCTFFHGFPFTDIPFPGITVVATADGDPALARRASEDVAAYIWSLRARFVPIVTPPAEAVRQARQALAARGGPVVVNDHSDNPGGGAPGDGTYLLQAILDAELRDACYGFIYDPETAEQAHGAGVGASLAVRLGGKTDLPGSTGQRLHGSPIETQAYVKCLTDGRFVLTNPMWAGMRVDYGRCARLAVGGVDVIVTSLRTQVLDTEVFLLHGIDVRRYGVVGVKSATHFRAGFEQFATEIIRADAPGLISTDLAALPYRRLRRPVWPLDRDDVTFPLHGTSPH